MKNLNEFINRGNRMKSNLRESSQNSSAFVDSTTNNDLIENVDEGFETFRENLEEAEEENPDFRDKKKVIQYKKGIRSKR